MWCADVIYIPIWRGFLYLVTRRVQWALRSSDDHKSIFDPNMQNTDCRRKRSVTEEPGMIWTKHSDNV